MTFCPVVGESFSNVARRFRLVKAIGSFQEVTIRRHLSVIVKVTEILVVQRPIDRLTELQIMPYKISS